MASKRNVRRILIVTLVLVLGFTGMVQAVKNDFYSATVDVGIVVSDVEKSVQFYRDALGFTEVGGFPVSGEMAGKSGLTNFQPFDVRVMVLGGEVNATKIKLMQLPQGTNKKVDNQFINSSLGLSYLTILVKDTQKALERCHRVGVKEIKDPYQLKHPLKYLTLVRDPDGNLIELVEPGPPTKYFVHGKDRTPPKRVTPPVKYGAPPSDATVLFDGSNFKEWIMEKGGTPAKWKLQDGYMEVVKKTGYLRTKKEFGNCQLHIEFATPSKVNPAETEQKRGNSGVFFGPYEVQVLDSYNNPTYYDGQVGAMYGQAPPLADVCLKPGEWQTYDIAFLAPIFDPKTKLLLRPGSITVFHNGTCVHNNYIIRGITHHKKVANYAYPARQKNPNRLPIRLQDHGNPMRFRNIWIRELDEEIPSSQQLPKTK